MTQSTDTTSMREQIEEASHKIMDIVNRHGENTSEGGIYWNREIGWDKIGSTAYNAEEDCRKEIAQFIATIASKSAEVEQETSTKPQLERGAVVFMKGSSGMVGYGNEQCVSWYSPEIGELSLFGHNQCYKSYDVERIVSSPSQNISPNQHTTEEVSHE